MGLEIPSNAEVLIDGEKVGGVHVKPWTISKCAALSPAFERIAIELKKRKLTFKDFFVRTKGKKDGDKESIEVVNIDQLFFAVMPFAPEILKITLDTDAAGVNKIKQDDVMLVIAAIVRQNIDYLKNLFALMVTMAQAIKSTTNSSGQ